MLKLNVKGTEYNIKFGYIPTLKTRLISRVVEKEMPVGDQEDGSGKNELARIEDMLLFLPEILLIGLQVNHKEDFGFNYDTGEGKEEKLEKAFEIADEYLNSEDAEMDAVELYQALEGEMLQNGFLKKTFQTEMGKKNQKNQKSVPDAKEEKTE